MKEGKLTNLLVNQGVLEEEQRELVEYGLYYGKLLLINSGIVLAIGIFFNQIPASVLFLAFFSVLRSYAGGYHASTSARCYVISTILVFGAIWSISAGIWTLPICISASIISTLIIMAISPVDNPNRALDLDEKKQFRKKAYIIAITELLLGMFGSILRWQILYQAVTVSLCLSGALAVAGVIHNLQYNKKK